MIIALINVINKNKLGAMNKDLAGGMGTRLNIDSSIELKLLSIAKMKYIKLPVLSLAFLQAILKGKGHTINYIEGDTIDREYDLVIIYGSIIDFRNENEVCKRIKEKYPKTKVLFFGSFPTVRPDLFSEADFVIRGEAESFFLYDFKGIKKLPRIINVKNAVDLNDLPTPDFDNFPIKSYSYFPAIREKPFLVLQSSRGCPFGCSYYCPYAMMQGQKYRVRSAEKVVNDIITLIKKYNIKSLQFRDPTFGLDKKHVREICNLIINKKINIKFGIETRLDILDESILQLMFKAGLRNINVGIETLNENTAKINKRKLIAIDHQEKIISFCKKIGIKVSAFYIIGLLGDTERSIKDSIKYAIKLDTNVAQFAISCPFPGTKFYDDLKSKNLVIEMDFEKFDSDHVIFKHDKLTESQIIKLREYAFRKYYFRIGYILGLIKWRLREF